MGFIKPIEQYLFGNQDTCIYVSKRYYTRSVSYEKKRENRGSVRTIEP